jgi:YHS domain-containing protein
MVMVRNLPVSRRRDMRLTLLLCSLTLMLGGAAVAYVTAAAEKPATAPATQPAAAAAPVNKKCPVSGDDVNPKGKTVTYKGKIVGFCCDDCIDLFNKNPDKYADKIK